MLKYHEVIKRVSLVKVLNHYREDLIDWVKNLSKDLELRDKMSLKAKRIRWDPKAESKAKRIRLDQKLSSKTGKYLWSNIGGNDNS